MSVAPPEFTPAPTPSCHDGDEATIREIEGPFFKPRSPRRSDLREPGVVGRPAELSGVVLTRACRPVAGALGDLWHADAAGVYDNKGFRLRGHVFTDGGQPMPTAAMARWSRSRLMLKAGAALIGAAGLAASAYVYSPITGLIALSVATAGLFSACGASWWRRAPDNLQAVSPK